MRFKAWAMFVLLLFVICRALATATPPVRTNPQVLPPTMVTGLLGVIYPHIILKQPAFEMILL
ncbi:MAG TPA: hypothetical protein DD666_13340 [Advenella kashmirensis]|uniref:Uncharacterized protein n=1 Tax=Advenella kashmirensis TaxID=310575 RepID=A0A356LIJ5_9BURK|nr:hypothetical protein [Advenella kashmirensis]